MIRDPSGILYAVRDQFGTYRAVGTFHDWPVRIEMRRADNIGGSPAVEIRIYDCDGAPASGPSLLIDGFGHEDPAPKQRDENPRRPARARRAPP